ncbi:MAG: hypothetical protein ACR2IE_14000 [Candidatus Sumerlaeaceae bacterium]
MYVSQFGHGLKFSQLAVRLLALLAVAAGWPQLSYSARIDAKEAATLIDKGTVPFFPWAEPKPIVDSDPLDPIAAKNVRVATDAPASQTWVAVYHTGNPNDNGTTPPVGQYSNLMVSYSNDDGGTWEQPFSIPVPDSETDYNFRPDIATDSIGDYVVVFEALTYSGPQLYKTVSADSGQTWDVPSPLGSFANNNNPRNASIGTDGFGKYMVTWVADADLGGTPGVNIAYSSDSGANWQLRQRIPGTGVARPQVRCNPGDEVDIGPLWVVTYQEASGDIDSKYAASNDDGVNWAFSTINTDAGADSKDDYVARIDYSPTNNTWAAVWGARSSGGIYDVYTARASQADFNVSDGGLVWSPPVQITNGVLFLAPQFADPWIATDDAGDWMAIWSAALNDVAGNPPRDVFSAVSTDDAASFGSPSSIDFDFQTSQPRWLNPVIASNLSGRWLAMWQNIRAPAQDENSPQTAVPWYSTTFLPLDDNYVDVEIKATNVNDGAPIFAGTTSASDFFVDFAVTNYGIQTAYNVQVSVNPDAPIVALVFEDTGSGAFILSTPAFPSPDVTGTYAELAPGQTETFRITFRSDTGGQYNIVSNALPETIDGDPAVDVDQSNNINVLTKVTIEGARTLADLRLTKTAYPDPAIIGEYLGYTITVRNLSSETANGVVVTDPLPAGLRFNYASVSSSPEGSWSVVNDGSNPSGNVTLVGNLGAIPAGARATFVIATTPLVGATAASNTACVDFAGGDPDFTNNCATASVQIIGGTGSGADLSLVMSSTVTTATQGTSVTYSLRVVNGGPSTATGVTINDTLPASVSYTGEFHTQGNVTRNGNVITANIGTLGAGRVATVNISVIPTTVGTISNTAQVVPLATDPDTSNNSSTKQITVTAANPATVANVGITKTANPSPGNVGSPLSYTLQVNNAGPAVAANVQIQDMLPPEVAFVSSTPTESSYANGLVTYRLASLAVGGTATFQIATNAIAGGVAVNTASISSDNPDLTPSNNVATISTIINGGSGPATNADLALSSSVTPTSTTVGNAIFWTLVATNNGPQSAASILVNTTLPNTVTFVSATGPGGSATPIGNSLAVPIPVLGPGASANVTIALVPLAAGSLTLTANITGNVNDSVAGNNSATSIVPVTGGTTFDLLGTWTKLRKKSKLSLVPTWTIKGTLSVQNLRQTLLIAAPVHFYLSTDSVFDASDTLVGAKIYKKIKPGKTKKKSVSVKLTSDPIGQYLIAVINPTGSGIENTVPILLP